MSAQDFFDTNVLLYLESPDIGKAARAADLLRTGGVVSVQVLNEFARVALRKLTIPFPEVRRLLLAARTLCSVVPIDNETHERALDIAERYRFDIFDSLIVASAQLAGCTTLYTEDLQDGQRIDGLTVRNPFPS